MSRDGVRGDSAVVVSLPCPLPQDRPLKEGLDARSIMERMGIARKRVRRPSFGSRPWPLLP
jgi:hypothetical protein